MKGLARLSVLSIGLRIGRFALGIGSSILLTRLMPIEQYGTFAYALVIAGLLAIPGEAGMPNLVMREIAKARSDGDWPRVRGMVRFASLTALWLTASMAVLAGLSLWLAAGLVPYALQFTLLAALPALLLGALANTRAGVQRALGDAISSQLPEQIVRPAALILFTLILWAWTQRPLNSFSAMIGYALASATAFGLGTVLLLRTCRAQVGAGPVDIRSRAWLAALLPFSAIAGVQIALVQVSALILGLIAPPSEVAVFRIATLTSDFVLFSVFAINALIAPQFAAHFHRGATAELQQLVGRVNRLNIAFALLVTLGLIALGPWGLGFVFGEAYRAAYLPMCILAAGHLVGATMGYATTLANMAGRERVTLIVAIFGLAINTALSILLCPRYGAVGAAAAAAITAVAWRLALSLWLSRSLGVRAWGVSRDFGSLLTRLGGKRGVE